MNVTTRESYTVAYQRGGPARFWWQKCAPTYDYTEAQKQAAYVRRMGYHCNIYTTSALEVIGLPDTWVTPVLA